MATLKKKIHEPEVNHDLDKAPLNDYSSAPPSVVIDRDLNRTMGSSTGRPEHAIEAGGWQGTDDATSTAPSDMANLNTDESEEGPLDEQLHVETYTDRTKEMDW